MTVLLAGCAGQAGAPPSPVEAPEIHDSWHSCETDQPVNVDTSVNTDALSLPRLGDDFIATSVTICGTGTRNLPSGAEESTATEQRSDQIDALVTALRRPDAPQQPDAACPAILIGVPWFVLQDAQGRWLRPGVPIDTCHQPSSEVRQALQNLPLSTVSTRKTGDLKSAAAAQSGCEQSWGNMAEVEARSEIVRPAPASYAGPAPAQVSLCRYAVEPAERATGKPRGDFTSGERLTAAQWTAIRDALPHGTTAAKCDRHASIFALLRPAGSAEIYVELDGCTRVLGGEGGLAPAPAALVALLAG